MTLIIKDKEAVEKKTPHLALCHETQGYSANNRPMSLLMKSDVELTKEQEELLKSLLGDDVEFIEKMSHNRLRQKMENAIKVFSRDRWDWAWVEDFDESVLVFSNNDGLYSVGYTINGDDVTLDSTANPVDRIISYEESTGKIILSEADNGVDVNVRNIIVKSFESISSNDKLKDVFKSKLEEGKLLMEQEIQKALAPVQAELQKSKEDLAAVQAVLQKAVADRDAAQKALADIEKAQADAKSAQRLALIKAVVADETQAIELHKSVEALEDNAFEVVVNTLKAKSEAIENSDLFKQVAGVEKEDVAGESSLAQLLKTQYASK